MTRKKRPVALDEQEQRRRAVRARCLEIAQHGRQEGWSQWQIVSACHAELDEPLMRIHRLIRDWTTQAAACAANVLAGSQSGEWGKISHSRIYHWETGERPNIRYLNLLCQLFETRPDRLGFGEDHTPEDERGDERVVVVPRPPTAPLNARLEVIEHTLSRLADRTDHLVKALQEPR